MDIKKADLAGSWYPGTALECENDIERYSRNLQIADIPEKEYSAGIVPHAGWYFSGNIACNVIKTLKQGGGADLVVVFGKHLHHSSPATILTNCMCETPFGHLEIAKDFSLELAGKLSLKRETADSFASENTIELQLPFIKYFFGNVKLVVIGAPPCEDSVEIGKNIVEIAKTTGLRVKIIGSTDMTHYGTNFGYTPAGTGGEAVNWVKNINDHRMIQAMVALDHKKILIQADKNRSACCSGAAVATVAAAKALGCEDGHLIAYSTSYDLSPGDSFVGYAGIVY